MKTGTVWLLGGLRGGGFAVAVIAIAILSWLGFSVP